MTSDIYQIKEILNESEPNSHKEDKRMANLLFDLKDAGNAYLNTKLTASEEMKSGELVKILSEFEASLSIGTAVELENTNKALALLNELSAIQLEESKLIMNRAEILFFSGKASLQFAFAVIIIVLLVLQAIVFTSKTLINNNQTSASYLN